ncbi:restriction endonuclease subunit S [Rothia sp. P5764]|uniref:restriction endonuclease subunit S n=1 Tax=Rothia sp. P5764 TaxID=3402654 RepID=UPI003AD4F5F7
MLSLSDREWKEFSYTEIFPNIGRGKRLKKDDHIQGKTPYVSATAQGNGVDGFVGNKESVRRYSNCLTVANSGSVGSAFFHPYDFVASDHVTSLKNPEIDRFANFFLATLVSRLEEKYSFNREINDSRIRREKILLPATAVGTPDWEFMSAFMRQQEQQVLERVLPYFQKRLADNLLMLGAVPDSDWGEVVLSDLFEVTIGKNLDGNKIDKDSGTTPYVTRKETSNGVDGFTDNHDLKFLWETVPAITIGNETAKPFVQTTSFYTGTKVNILTPRQKMSPGVLRFIARCLEANKERYSYSYTANSTRLAAQRIMLPTKADGTLNTVFMEQTIARLENDTLTYATELLQNRYNDLMSTTTLRGGELENRKWSNFSIFELFSLKKGAVSNRSALSTDHSQRGIPYLGATNRNNAVIDFVSPSSLPLQDGKCIAFICDGEGSMGYSVYKEHSFVATINVVCGYSSFLNRYTGQFVTTIADRVRGKYTFGYKRKLPRLAKEQLTLPSLNSEEPDWDFMVRYMCAQETLTILRMLRPHMLSEVFPA